MATAQQIVIKPFDGNGYSNWEFRVKLILEKQEVLGVIEQDPPMDQEELKQFKKDDIKARNIL